MKIGKTNLQQRYPCFDSGLQLISEWHSINVTWIGNCEDDDEVTNRPIEDKQPILPLPIIENCEISTIDGNENALHLT